MLVVYSKSMKLLKCVSIDRFPSILTDGEHLGIRSEYSLLLPAFSQGLGGDTAAIYWSNDEF